MTTPPDASAPIPTVLLESPSLFSCHADVAAKLIQNVLDRHPIRLLTAVDRAFRDGAMHKRLGIPLLDVSVDQVQQLPQDGSCASSALGIASVVRNGYAREEAVCRLAVLSDTRALGFVMLRIDDVVEHIAGVAEACLQQWLRPRHADALVACLPLVRQLETRKRARGTRALEALLAFLLSDEVRCREALWNGTTSQDSEVRRRCCQLLADHCGEGELRKLLLAALGDPAPATRRWGAATVRRKIVPESLRRELLDTLECDRDPFVRLTAVRTWAREGDTISLEKAVYDLHSEVRFFARKYLHAKGVHFDQRVRAMEILNDESSDRAHIIGALAALSEVGHREDAALLRRFAEDHRASVAREAGRTLRMLEV